MKGFLFELYQIARIGTLQYFRFEADDYLYQRDYLLMEMFLLYVVFSDKKDRFERFFGTCSGILVPCSRVEQHGDRISVFSLEIILSVVSVWFLIGFEKKEVVWVWGWLTVLSICFDLLTIFFCDLRMVVFPRICYKKVFFEKFLV